MNVECRSCEALHWQDERLKSSALRNPKFGTCCHSGNVSLPLLQNPPNTLHELFLGNTIDGQQFLDNIRQYNAAFAFTSLGVKQDHAINHGAGPYVFRIHGGLYHRAGALLPVPGEQPSYAQLYVHDPRAAADQRSHRNENLRPAIIQMIQTVLSEHHFYAGIYRHAHEVLQQYPVVEDVAFRLHCLPGRDRRCYNLPTADEISIILPGDGSQHHDSRDIILRLRSPDGAPLQRISEGHSAYACLHYVLLFPYGEDGWHWKHEHTQAEYYSYRLFPRRTEFNAILRAQQLLQQYIVDMWACTDQNRLRYLRHNQTKLRASLYSGLEEAMSAADREVTLAELGQRFILPSSYVGGPRYMQQCLQDALALARYFQQIDLFITVTCNPQWVELQEALLPGQSASDRPDLVARIFNLKKNAILKYIKSGAFGTVQAHIYTIEFQKRGLPHMHLLVFLERRHKLMTPEDVDSAICAEWPDPDEQPLLFETVSKCMVHGPCGALNPSAPCMEDGKCTKYFPKPFQEQTLFDKDSYPLYRRRDNGTTHEVRGHQLDNRWIVPYNPRLSADFNCHINVECAVGFVSAKYVNKYIHKGCDRTTLEIEQRDEIKRYIDARYVSAPEAAWRLFRNEIHHQEPNVVRLQVHLPGQHMVTYDENLAIEEVVARAANEQTMLTEFFRANANEGEVGLLARQVTYQEFPQHFVWKADKKCWAIRQRGFAIGRMYFVPPTAQERFYLRMLLCVVKGACSYEGLRTYHGVIYPTFRNACIARGLLEDDGEWRQCLQDAAEMQTGTRLRHLFATILIFCHPTNPASLWNDFRHHICDDLRHRLITVFERQNPTDHDVYDYGLFLLDTILHQSGTSLQGFPPMPIPTGDWGIQAENRMIAEQLNYDRASEQQHATTCIRQLNAEQRDAFHRVTNSVSNNLGKIYFVNGPGGTGKTFLYNTICHAVRADGHIVLCVASSGIAALLLCGGRTAHSMFKIPVNGLTDETFCPITKESSLAAMLRLVKLIVWDEIGMQDRRAPEAVDRTLRDLCSCEQPFGGITVLFGGDFQQILPVIVKGSREDVIGASLQRSYIWGFTEIIKLHQNMRLENDPTACTFSEWLLNVGHGRLTAADGMMALPANMKCESIDTLISFIYPHLNGTIPPPPEYFLHRMILSARNSDVEDLNLNVLRCMHGEPEVHVSADSVEYEPGVDGEQTPFPPEYLRSLTPSGLPPGELHLKPGCPLMLLRNLAPARGLCNGTRMVLIRATDRVLETRLIGGDHDGDIAFIPRITLTPSTTSNPGVTFMLRRRQFPVRLAFAMTINKSQGQSAKYIGLDLRCPVFAHGQLYVALSRATSGSRIRAVLPADTPHLRTMNVVYPEVLLD